jgi:uncharacterized protein (TIGR03067 family)
MVIRGSWAVFGAACFVAALAHAQVYKSTDANGRVVYSDKPPPASVAAPAATPSASELAGAWTVANATLGGELRHDDKLVGATWTFTGSDLAIRLQSGDTQRFRLRIDALAQPRAFEVAPASPSGEAARAMIYERDGPRLRIAWLESGGGLPVSFEPARKVVVLTLVPGAGGVATSASGPRDACALLRGAGVVEFLGTAEVAAKPGANPATGCRIEQALGLAVTVVLTGAASRETLEREKTRFGSANAAGPQAVVRDEPELGPGAFSIARGNFTLVAALTGDTLVLLRFDYPPGNQQRISKFARRVVAGV